MKTLCFDFFFAWVITVLLFYSFAPRPPLKQKRADEFFRQGWDWIMQGDYDRAITNFSKAIELKPRYGEAYIGRGNAWHSRGNSNVTIAFKRGQVLADIGEYDRAISDYNKAIELDPKFAAEAYYFRGDVWYSKGDFDRACSDWHRACELDLCDTFNAMKKQGICK